DGIKKDSEIKILINCSEKEKQEILKCQNFGKMKAILIYKFNED
ncbi:MAG: hypothetical protein US75_C0004G0031, partial [Candidatus Woesebacteria bacterium GW2011_GWC1_38_13]